MINHSCTENYLTISHSYVNISAFVTKGGKGFWRTVKEIISLCRLRWWLTEQTKRERWGGGERERDREENSESKREGGGGRQKGGGERGG